MVSTITSNTFKMNITNNNNNKNKTISRQKPQQQQHQKKDTNKMRLADSQSMPQKMAFLRASSDRPV